MISSVEIQGLRGIRTGELKEFTPLVILVGPNASGKSTVLEAILVGGSPTPGDAIGRSVRRHRGITRGYRWLLWKSGSSDPTQVTVRTDTGASRRCELCLDQESPDTHRIGCRFVDIHVGSQGSFEVVVNFGSNNTYDNPRIYRPLDGVPEVRLIEPHTTDLQTPLYELYTRTVEQGRRRQAKDIVSGVVPGIDDIEILAEGEAPTVHLVYEDRSVPAALAGDGIQSLLRLTLELAARRKGTVLLEEPEVHLHPGAIRQAAKVILSATRQDIQVILSTHSLELIDALLAESSASELEWISLYRLQLQDGNLRSSRLPGPEVAFARSTIEDDLR